MVTDQKHGNDHYGGESYGGKEHGLHGGRGENDRRKEEQYGGGKHYQDHGYNEEKFGGGRKHHDNFERDEEQYGGRGHKNNGFPGRHDVREENNRRNEEKYSRNEFDGFGQKLFNLFN